METHSGYKTETDKGAPHHSWSAEVMTPPLSAPCCPPAVGFLVTTPSHLLRLWVPSPGEKTRPDQTRPDQTPASPAGHWRIRENPLISQGPNTVWGMCCSAEPRVLCLRWVGMRTRQVLLQRQNWENPQLLQGVTVGSPLQTDL